MFFEAMEFHIPVQMPSLATLFFLSLFLYYVLWRRNSNLKRQPPVPAGSWPILGHINLLKGTKVPHIVLANLAEEYGPIFTIKLGIRQVLVVSSRETAKECLVDNDKVFVNRPQTVAVKRLAYNSAMFGFAPYGPYWRELRKIVTFELLSNHQLDILKHVRIFEVRNAVESIYDKWAHARKDTEHDNGILVEMKHWFGNLSLKVTTKLVAGSTSKELFQIGEYDRYYKSISEFFHYFGLSTISDAFPFMRWLDIGRHEKAMKRVAKELDQIIQGWLDKHRRVRISGYYEKGKQDFMDVMLDTFDTAHENLSKFELDTIIKATCLNIIIAASDTSTVTLTWTLSLLLNNRRVLKKVQHELDTHIGGQRLVNESDMTNLVYLHATLKEAIRLYPAAPLAGPREAITDCDIRGYHIPRGTQLCVNIYKIQRDPSIWSNQDEFYPERFLTTHKDVDVRGQSFELIPFGSGRRICPGISFAFQIVLFTLANLLYGFEIMTPLDELVDMTERCGLTNEKATPLEVILTPRLPENLYNSTSNIQ